MSLKKAVKSVPVIRNWIYNRSSIEEWDRKIGDVNVVHLAPSYDINQYEQDDFSGKLTGVDTEGKYETSFCRKFIEILGDDPVFLDIGAAYGDYSILAWNLTNSRNIYSIEAEDYQSWLLNRNNKKYCSNQLHIFRRKVAEISGNNEISIDDFCDSYSIKPTIIKMDIEGFEYFAVQGMKKVCEKYHPQIIMEYHYRKMRDKLNINPDFVIDKLKEYGYNLQFNGHHWHTVQNKGVIDTDWHEEIPNDVNFALWAFHSESIE